MGERLYNQSHRGNVDKRAVLAKFNAPSDFQVCRYISTDVLRCWIIDAPQLQGTVRAEVRVLMFWLIDGCELMGFCLSFGVSRQLNHRSTTGQELQLTFIKHQIGGKCDFNPGMVVSARCAGLSISKTAGKSSGISTHDNLYSLHNGTKKHPVSSGAVGRSALSMRAVKGEWPDWFELQ